MQVKARGRTVMGGPAGSAQSSRFLCALLVLVFVSAACGTTVSIPPAGLATGTSDGPGSAAAPSSDDAQLSVGGGATVGNANPTSVSAKPGGSIARSGGNLGAKQPSGLPASTDNRPVEVGAYVVKNGTQGAAAAGYSNIVFGDQEAEVDAIVADLNKDGGLLGHPVRPIYSYLDPENPASYDNQAQAACSNWTEDHHVIAVVSTTQSNAPLVTCLRNKSIPLIAAAVFQWPRRSFRENPLLVTPHSPNEDQVAGIYVDQLAAQQFFAAESPARPTKIGVMIFDDPAQRDVSKHSLEPALAQHHLSLAATEAVNYPKSGTDLGTSAQQVQAVVLKFRAENITHVLFLDSKGLMPLFFMPAAESGQYHPRYGLSSYDDPGFTLQGTVPNAQLHNSKGLGWGAFHDVDTAHSPGLSPTARHCFALMRAANQDMSKESAAGLAAGFCDGFFLLQAAVSRGGEISPEGFRLGLESLGSSFIPAATFAVAFGTNRHAGVFGYRRFAFFDSCNCFRYTSGTFSIPPERI